LLIQAKDTENFSVLSWFFVRFYFLSVCYFQAHRWFYHWDVRHTLLNMHTLDKYIYIDVTYIMYTWWFQAHRWIYYSGPTQRIVLTEFVNFRTSGYVYIHIKISHICMNIYLLLYMWCLWIMRCLWMYTHHCICHICEYTLIKCIHF